ncbi:glucans biosynthesis protein [Rubripirellula amarantea]|uniref:Glucans biosynthesis protein n=1 Tax=Rubripirellula amarantea TaxID=2527999 RepID=A0A5C5WHT8_9BACT|nr:acyltransferase [Rubripirellula amarantea]TWT50358.1 glucans biosynthesis protein [Rubripirellula amarantea]
MNSLRLHHDETPPAPTVAAGDQTLVGLDAVRALAAVAVVVLHACVPYLAHPMPGLVWSVTDSPSPVVDFVFWGIELVIMPLFLIISGLFAYRTYQRKGEWALVRNRFKRLLRPLLFALLVILPLDLYVWVFSWVCEGIVPPVKLKSLKFDGDVDRHLWGLGHLWFLHYLFSYIAVFAISVVASKRFKRFASCKSVSTERVVAALFIVAAITIYFRPEVIWGFQHAFMPVASKWIYNAMFFALGIVIARSEFGVDRLRNLHPRWVGVGGCVMVATVLLGIWSLEQNSFPTAATLSANDAQANDAHSADLGAPQFSSASLASSQFTSNQRASSGILAMATAASSMLGSVIILSLALRYVVRLSATMKYLAAASFWVYLVHHPVLGLIHLDLKWLLPNVLPSIKAVMATILATAVSLVSYEAFVRTTRLGEWLGMNAINRTPVEHLPVQDQDDSQHDVLPMPTRTGDPMPPARRAA